MSTMSIEKKCFVPTCSNSDQNNPNKLIVPIIDSLKELWCRKLNLDFNSNTSYYCCEDHLNPEEDLENYQLCKLMNGEPKMKTTATLRLHTPSESDVGPDPLKTAESTIDLSQHKPSELFKLLLSEETNPKKSHNFEYSSTWPFRVSVGVQCKAKTRDASVSFLGRKNIPIGFKQSTAATYTEVELTDVKHPACCCCLLRSPNSDVRTPYTCDDRTDTCADMLRHLFGIELTLENDDECGICEECVGRVRAARDFQLQVQRSQAELRARRRPTSVKSELTADDSDMSENCMDDNESYCPSEPAVKLETLDGRNEDAKIFITYNEVPIEVKREPSPDLTEPTISSRPEPREDHTPHECHVCHKTYKRETTLKKHMRVHEKQLTQVKKRDSSEDECHSVYECDECGKRYKTKLSYTKHMQTHETYKPYTCDICSKVFSHEGYLTLHKKSHTREPYRYTCDICKRKFTKKRLLTTHILTHMYGKQYKCEICNKKFANKYSLRGHKLLHIKDKRYSCDICKKQFAHAKLLERHNIVHKKGSYVCESCGRQFLCLSTYNIHRRTHTGEKPYECSICKKQFASNGNMKMHQRTHTGEKPYACEFCPKRFTCSSGLNHHRPVHTGERSAECDICGKFFSQYSSMKLHKLIHTGEKPHCCHVCGRKFARREHLRRHLETHMERKSYACEYCPKIYTHKHGFAQHVRDHKKRKINN